MHLSRHYYSAAIIITSLMAYSGVTASKIAIPITTKPCTHFIGIVLSSMLYGVIVNIKLWIRHRPKIKTSMVSVSSALWCHFAFSMKKLT